MKRFIKPKFFLDISKNSSPITDIITPTPTTFKQFTSSELDQIVPNLWLGTYPDNDTIKKHNFTHILSLYDKIPDYNTDNIKLKHINLIDSGHQNIRDYFDECANFIHESLLQGGNVYVHCKYGISRSPTFVIAFIMKYGPNIYNEEHYTFEDALQYVRTKRSGVCPNLGFNLELHNYENLIMH